MNKSTPLIFLAFWIISWSSFFCAGCSPETKKGNCHFTKTSTDKFTIPFNDGDAHEFIFSPFEKDKVFVGFRNAKNIMMEFDLVTQETQVLRHNHWKKIYSNGTPIYQDQRDSLVWIGGPNRNLLKYDQRTKKAKYLPIKYVHKIIPYNSKIYFVAFKGLYVKDRATDEIKKVENISLEPIQRVEVLDEKTLILGAKITYDLETDTWQDGIQREPKMNNRLSSNGIGKSHSFSYKRRKDFIDKIDVQTNEIISFEYLLPEENNYSPIFSYDDDIIWIYRIDQLHFINTISKENYIYPSAKSDRFKSMIYDDCYIYLLFEKRLEVWDKSEFLKNCQIFSKTDYLAEFEDFKQVLDSTQIFKEKDEQLVVKKLKALKERYANSTHTEILKRIENLNSSAFYSVKYESTTNFRNCYSNEQLPVQQRINCFQRLIRTEGMRLNFVEVLAYEEEFKNLMEPEILASMSYFLAITDSIRSYVNNYDSLGLIGLPSDSVVFYRAMASITICRYTFFCHGGCGGCDYSLLHNALKEFISEFPNSLLIDDAELAMMDYGNFYDEEFSPGAEIKDLENFKTKFPNSNLLNDVDYRILSSLYHSLDEMDKVGLIPKLEHFTTEYPNDARVNQIHGWVRKFKN